MRLTQARIKNFRSIKTAHVSFDPRCRILVGINESGKSNILAALGLLDPTAEAEPEDARVPLPNERPTQESWVKFDLQLDTEEIASAADRAAKKVLARADHALAQHGGRSLSLAALFRSAPSVVYSVLLTQPVKRGFQYYKLPADVSLATDWLKVGPDCPAELTVEVAGAAIPLRSFSLVSIKDYPAVSRDHLVPATTPDLVSLYAEAILAEAKECDLPSVVTWAYSESHLLPPATILETFMADPKTCLPLRNMFTLAGHVDIRAAFTEAAKTAVGRRNLLKRVGAKATRHLHKVWGDSTKLKIELASDGPHIRASVVDAFNNFEFSRRSDGFKRFASFLLVVSVTERTGELRDTLLLVDEPEGGLHPSGARFLRDELLRTARSNYVVYSTHSTFMIDPTRIDRHLVVTKKREITSVAAAEESDLFEEEVLYNALGASIFEHLKTKNVLFEGWRDQRLYLVAVAAGLGSASSRESLKQVGHCFGRGVKSVKGIAPYIQLAQRKLLIVTDDDQVAIEDQRTHVETRSHGLWLRYSELMKDPGRLATSEDLIKPAAFVTALEALCAATPDLPTDSEPDWAHPKGRLAGFRAWLAKSGIPVDRQARTIGSLKDLIFEGLKAADIHESYGEVIDGIAQATDSL